MTPPPGVGEGDEVFLTALSGDDVAFSLFPFNDKHVFYFRHAVGCPGCKPISRKSRHEWL